MMAAQTARPARMTSLELLRVKSMFATTWSHMSVYVPFSIAPGSDEAKKSSQVELVYCLVCALQHPSVNTFLAIGALFGVRSRTLNVRRLFGLWYQIWFFHIFTILLTGKHRQLSGARLWALCCAFGSVRNWYAQRYFYFALLIPGINRCILSLRKIDMKIVLAAIILTKIYVYRGIAAFYWDRHWMAVYGFTLKHMLSMYVTMAYFAVYGNPFSMSATVYLYFLMHWFHMNIRFGAWTPSIVESVLHTES